AAALLLAALAPWLMRAFGAPPDVAAEGAVFLRCIGPYLVLMGGFIALGGVFEGSGGAARVLGVTSGGTVLQLGCAFWLSGVWGLPGVCLALGLAMAVQCGCLVVMACRAALQEAGTEWSRAA
ncbi:MATE family efflux transporter, partial [Streptomyces sp. SID14478]|uniref:MATE family efflux transporter n=1 Tax=Streptomyces sp. SID14478 TaxID=2706073 RepID=UPI001410FF33